LECCPRGTAPSCPVHRHPSGSDRLAEAERSVGAGTAMHCLVAPPPLGRCPPGRVQGEPVLGPALEVAVCTATGATVHHRDHYHPMVVHRPIFPERRENGGLA
jgi:hypothetical protein